MFTHSSTLALRLGALAQHLAAALAATGLAAFAPASPQFVPPASTPATAIFQPTDFVPLSEFAQKSGTTVTLHVDPAILTWLSTFNSNFHPRIAIRSAAGTVSDVPCSAFNAATGEVTFTSSSSGHVGVDVVVVSRLVRQHLLDGDSAVVTHWSSGANAGRGGRVEGANGALAQPLDMTDSGAIVFAGNPCAPKSYINPHTVEQVTFTVDSTEDWILPSGVGLAPFTAVQMPTTGAVPGGLVAGATYYTFRDPVATPAAPACSRTQLASSLANAQSGIALDITGVAGVAYSLKDLDYAPNAHPTAGPYFYLTDKYSLFSDGGVAFEGNTIRTPHFERYLGENYSPTAVKALAAIRFSDLVRERSGYPVAHRHQNGLTNTALPPKAKIANNIPLFQLVNGYTVAYDDGDSANGLEQSIASFVLPPGWSQLSGSYPIVFHSHYDLNTAMYYEGGGSVFDAIGALARETPTPRLAVGVVWNAGAAWAGFSFQPSLNGGANKLFDDMVLHMRADRHRIMAFGGSRGGVAALRLASNPIANYTVRWLSASTPQVKIGFNMKTANPTYDLGMSSLVITTGYVDAWRSAWTDPDTGISGRELSALTQFNSIDFDGLIDGTLSIDSPPMVANLAVMGPGVVLRSGTHDHASPTTQVIEYARNLRAAGVKVEIEVHYRQGHSVPETDEPSPTTLLRRVFNNTLPTSSTAQQFATAPSSHAQSIPFPASIPFQPLAVQAPFAVGIGQPHIWRFVGAPGSYVRVRARKLAASWNYGEALSYAGGTTITVLTTTLSAAVSGDPWGVATYSHLGFPNIGASKWLYEVEYDHDYNPALGPQIDQVLGLGDVAGPAFFEASKFTVDPATDTLTLLDADHGVFHLARVRVTSTANLPAGLPGAPDYYAVQVSPTQFKLAASRADALAGAPIVNITGSGSGVHSIQTLIEPVIELLASETMGKSVVAHTGGVGGDGRL